MPIKIAIAGAAGRMGRRIIALAHSDEHVQIVAALEHADSPMLGQDAGLLAGIGAIERPVQCKLGEPADALIDFSTPAGTDHWIDVCISTETPIVIGTTGHTDQQLAKIRAASEKIAVVKAANMSVGVNVLLRVAKLLGQTLDNTFDVEISETHHRFKVDAPSGTAIALKDAVQSGREAAGRRETTIIHGRKGQTGERPPGEIGIHALRLGDTVGEHTIAFGSLGETITIGHAAHTRDTFASGALRAAKWIAGRRAGNFDMQDVLFGGRE